MPSESLDFSRRAYLSEWMDEPCTYVELRDCFKDLARVNTLLGGYKPSLRWLSRYFAQHPHPANLLDVGSGGGDVLLAIESWAARHKHSLQLTGIDLNPMATQAACEASPSTSRIAWKTCDAFLYKPSTRVDLIISSLFTHHLTELEIVRFLVWMEETAIGGWYINDLRRSMKAYYSFQALAWAMRWHRFVRHDGPVSVRRGFLPEDWKRMCAAAGLQESDYQIEEKPFGRLCVSRIKS